MFKKIVLLAIVSLVFVGIGCGRGSQKEGAKNTSSDNIPLNVSDGSELSSGSIELTNPKAEATLTSPFLVSGKAEVPGNKVYVRVKNAEGKAVIEAWTTARNGFFGVNLDFQFKGTKAGTIEVFGKDEAGSEVGLQSVAVKFEPNLE